MARGRTESSGYASDALAALFSLAFQREGARLVYWKPQQSGGELALDASWGAVPALFSRLALENARVSAFSITPQGKQLRLSLQLEIGHAQ